jgi:hypothetical protein
VGWFEDLLAKALTPRGEPVPPGHHLTSDDGYSRIGGPEAPLVFNLPLWSEDHELLGRYAGIASNASRFYVDGELADVEVFLDSYGREWDHIQLDVIEPGLVDAMSMTTRESDDG